MLTRKAELPKDTCAFFSVLSTDSSMSVKQERNRVTLLKTFPEEVWLIILERINSPDDFQSIYNANMYLRSLLLPKATHFLFPSAWKLLESQFYHYTREETRSGRNGFICTSTKLCLPGILNSRAVCKLWRYGVDTSLQSLEICKSSGSLKGDYWPCEDFSSDIFFNKISAFILHFQNTHSSTYNNPFIRRRMFLTFKDNVGENYWWWIHNLLVNYGRHIWYLKLKVSDAQRESRMPCYLKIKEILELMPNLKSLEIEYANQYQSQDLDLARVGMSKQLEILAADIRNESPLPTLPNLQILVTKNLLSSVLAEICRANAHVTILQINGQSPVCFDKPYNMLGQFPNLKSFSLQVFSTEQMQALMEKDFKWNLDILKLKFSKQITVDFHHLFDLIIKKFAGVVTSLEISVARSNNNAENKPDVANFKTEVKNEHFRLERLNLKVDRLHNWNLFLPLKDTLKYLDVTIENVMVPDLPVESSSRAAVEAEETKYFGLHTKENLLKGDYLQLFSKLEKIDFVEYHPYDISHDNVQALKWTITGDEIRK